MLQCRVMYAYKIIILVHIGIRNLSLSTFRRLGLFPGILSFPYILKHQAKFVAVDIVFIYFSEKISFDISWES